MKFIDFTHIEIKNFLSIGHDPVVIDFNPGLNIITGTNKDRPDRRNAVGKSSIVESLYYAVFGTTLREVRKDFIGNNITNSTTEVILDFTITEDSIKKYRIIRTLNPTKVFLYEDNIDITRDSIANTNAFIQKLLCATPQIFKNCVIMTVNGTVPFMGMGKVDKRKFIEDIFGLEVFSYMTSQVRDEYNAVKKQHDSEYLKFEEVSQQLNRLTEQRSSTLIQRKQKHDLYVERKQLNIKSRAKLQQDIDAITLIDNKALTHQLNQLKQAVVVCDEKINDISSRISSCKTQVKLLVANSEKIKIDSSTCPMCLQSITDEARGHVHAEKSKISEQISAIDIERSALEKELVTWKEKKAKVTTSLDVIQKQLYNAQINNNKKKSLNDQISQLNNWLLTLDEDINSTLSDKTEFDQIIEESDTRKNTLLQAVNEFKDQLSVLDMVKFVVSEEGVKSYIVNKLLQLLNSKIQYYLQQLDSPCICTFNEYFEEEIFNESNKLCSYFNFSGAERKAIDLACLFTFLDIRRVQSGVSYNIALYDELFDSSLDEKGIELVLDILRKRIDSYNECVYVISHRRESTKKVTGEVIYLEKVNGITRRVEFHDE